MCKDQLSVSDFTWRSTAAYFRHIEVQAGLIQFSLSSAYSFYIPPDNGVSSLVTSKVKLLGIITENLARLQKWVDANKGHLDDREMTLVRSLYRQTARLQTMVEGHAVRAKQLEKWEQVEFDVFASEGGEENDLPF